ncbi:MAG: glycosyltransferase [Actinobacteria bacterium]|nr:glycosyltransferase [Actinomycetota bacterium]
MPQISKFALVSEALPPGWSGNAVLIGLLLAELEPASYCLLSSDQGFYGGEHGRALAATRYQLPRPLRIPRGTRFGLHAPRSVANAALGILARAAQIARIARQERCEAIAVFTGDFHDPPGSYLASRLLRVPLYFYICDSYAHRELYDPARRRLSPWLERTIVRGAAGVVCANEALRDDLLARQGVEATLIHHPCDLSLFASSDDGRRPSPQHGDELRIVYTGTVYEAQLDALRNLQESLGRLAAHRASLHVYTGQAHADLLALGLRDGFTYHAHRPAEAISAVQQQADVLFLPLAFRSRYPDVIRMSAPMKFGEYLAAGRPILAHAPPDSFVVRYCLEHECALVVDEPDPGKLAEAVERLATDSQLRQRLTRNARARALQDFDVHSARAKFTELLGLGASARQATATTWIDARRLEGQPKV